MKFRKKTTATGLTFLMLLVLLLTKTSCRKTDYENKVIRDNQIVEKFFQKSSTADPIVQKVIAELKKVADKNDLIENLVKNNGYALWDKGFSKIKKDKKNILGRNASGTNDTIVIIPFAQENTSTVSAYIEAHISDSLRMSLYQSNQYINYSNGILNSSVNNAEKFAYEFMLLEKRVFNHTRFKIIDSNLFKNAFGTNNIASNQFRYLNINSISTTANKNPDDDEDTQQNPCIEIWYDPDGDADPCDCSGNEYFDHYEGDCGGGGGYIGGFGYGFGDYGNWYIGGQTGGGSNGNGGGNSGTPPGWLAVDGSGNNPPSGGSSSSYSNNNRTDSDYGTGDDDNNTQGNYDNTSYSDYDDQTQPWPTIQNVISISDFVGWNRILHPTWQCMDYAKAQIAKKGYSISNYFDAGQTIQIYTAANGVDKNAAKNAVGYLISTLQRGIPVIVGVDDQAGSPNPNTDNTTDHFIVIVGTGSDTNGTYFTFYDNASGDPIQGANINNKLYYYPSTGFITGKSQTDYAKSSNRHDYIVTMIRKSK